jgi:hypothetical protein
MAKRTATKLLSYSKRMCRKYFAMCLASPFIWFLSAHICGDILSITKGVFTFLEKWKI